MKMHRYKRQRKKQTGVALISVLLVFAIVVVIASEVVSRHYRDIRRTANIIHSRQAYYYALAGEQLARQILYRDFIDGLPEKTDKLTDSWVGDLQWFEIDNGHMSVEIVDLQSRFNLNNVRNSATAAFEFRQLLNVLNIDTDYTAVLQDWLDDNTAVLALGAEDEVYGARRTPYATANRAMSDRSELRLLSEMSAEHYGALKNYVTALPVGTKYNLNTLDAKLVKALSNTITDIDVQRIAQQQQRGGYPSVAQWLANEAGTLSTLGNVLAVHSEYFEVIVKVSYDERRAVLRTQLFRDNKNGQIQVLKREQVNE